MDERELIGRAIAGDRSAERQLYDRHVERVYRLAHRLTGSQDVAEDCTQLAFVRAFSRLAEFRGDAALASWLHQVTVRVALNELRRRRRWTQREVALDIVPPRALAPNLGAAPNGADPDLKQAIRDAVEDLAPSARAVLVMHDLEGYTHQEIARMLGIRPGTSKARLSRARARLRQVLSRFAPEGA